MSKNKFANWSRRDFIKHFGAASGLAVPLLRSQLVMGQTTTAPTRVLFVPLQHGWGYDTQFGQRFTGTEYNFTLPAPLDVFNPIKNQCVFIDGLRSNFWGNAHDASYSDILTNSVRFEPPVNSALGGPFFSPSSASLDHVLGSALNKGVLRFSNHYASFGAPYHPLSFDASLRRLPYLTTPREAHINMIAPLSSYGGQPSIPDSVLQDRQARNRLLSLVKSDSEKLLSYVGTGPERQKIENFLASTATLEQTVTTTNTNILTQNGIALPAQPSSSLSFFDSMSLFLQYIRIAFLVDTHRVAVLGLGDNGSDNSFQWTDTSGAARTGNTFGNDFHQDIGHYGNGKPTPNNRRAYEGWVRSYGQRIVNFVQSLSNTTDIDGRPMIDNTLIVLFGEVGNGEHNRGNMTYVLIGGGGRGRIRRGRWMNLPKATSHTQLAWRTLDASGNVRLPENWVFEPHVTPGGVAVRHTSDLWTAVADLAGVPMSQFGLNVYNTSPLVLT